MKKYRIYENFQLSYRGPKLGGLKPEKAEPGGPKARPYEDQPTR